MPREFSARDAASPPANRLPLTPKITADEQVDIALHELSYLKSRRETITSACQQRIELIKSEAQQQLVTDLDGDEVPFAVRETLLEEAVKSYVSKHRKRLLAESGGKTRKFTHGEISWRATPAGVAIVEGKTAADVIAKIGALFERGLPGEIHALLSDAELVEGISVDQVVRVKLELDKTALAKLYRDEKLAKGDLRRFSLCAVAAGEAVAIKINDYPVTSEAAA